MTPEGVYLLKVSVVNTCKKLSKNVENILFLNLQNLTRRRRHQEFNNQTTLARQGVVSVRG